MTCYLFSPITQRQEESMVFYEFENLKKIAENGNWNVNKKLKLPQRSWVRNLFHTNLIQIS
jgi:hypothetical protein